MFRVHFTALLQRLDLAVRSASTGRFLSTSCGLFCEGSWCAFPQRFWSALRCLRPFYPGLFFFKWVELLCLLPRVDICRPVSILKARCSFPLVAVRSSRFCNCCILLWFVLEIHRGMARDLPLCSRNHSLKRFSFVNCFLTIANLFFI